MGWWPDDTGGEIDGVYNATPAALVDGGRSPLQLDQFGDLKVGLVNPLGAPLQSFVNPGDGAYGGGQYLAVLAEPYLYNGANADRQRTPSVFKVVDAIAIGAEATIWTPASGKKFRLMGAVLAASAAVTVKLRDNTAGTVIRELLLEASKSLVLPFEGNGSLSAAANNVLTATGSAAANLTGYLFGTEE